MSSEEGALFSRSLQFAVPVCATSLLIACGNSGGGSPAPAPAATAPVISLGPASQAAAVGASVSFSVSATGSPTRYQWRRNGADIVGQTGATYTKVVDLVDDGSRISVAVANGAGGAVSADALLTVYPVP